MSATAAYKFNSENLPKVPGATWVDGRPGPAPNTPLPSLPKVNHPYMPLDVHLRRTYEDDEHGWQEVKCRHSNRPGWRGSKKSKGRGPSKTTMGELIANLGGRSFLIALV